MADLIEFDPAKDAINVAKHGLSFTAFVGFDAEASVRVDGRVDYGETRYVARGRINGVGYCVVFTRTGAGLRLISFRRAHEREMRRYEQDATTRGLR